MLVRDRPDAVFKDQEFADLFPKDGRPGLSPGQLALVPVPQFTENLSDRAAANAVRTRVDWKYALGLELDDPGFDHSVLCEFRAPTRPAPLAFTQRRQPRNPPDPHRHPPPIPDRSAGQRCSAGEACRGPTAHGQSRVAMATPGACLFERPAG